MGRVPFAPVGRFVPARLLLVFTPGSATVGGVWSGSGCGPMPLRALPWTSSLLLSILLSFRGGQVIPSIRSDKVGELIAFQKWAESGRRELNAVVASAAAFRSIEWTSTRNWSLSTGAASTVALGATCSPAMFQVRFPEYSFCVWDGCEELGSWDHICWTCTKRPIQLARPHFWLSRLGWSVAGDCPDHVTKVRRWLVQCQEKIWEANHGAPDLVPEV